MNVSLTDSDAGHHRPTGMCDHRWQSKAAPAQEPKTGHQILLRNRHRGYKYEL